MGSGGEAAKARMDAHQRTNHKGVGIKCDSAKPSGGSMSASATHAVAKFRLGRIVSTPNALESITQDDILTAIGRHQSGDWGDVCAEDRKANDESLVDGTRILSVYHAANGTKFWLITEADRSVTTVLLPEDY